MYSTDIHTQEELVQLYKETMQESYIQELMRRNSSLFVIWADKYTLTGYDLDDKLSEAYIALLQAVKEYRECEGVKFISFLKSCVYQRYNRLYAELTRKKRYTGSYPLSWEGLEEIHKEGFTVDCNLSELEVKEFINSLEGKLQEIAISLFYGYSKTEIAKAMEITPATLTYHIKRLQIQVKEHFYLTSYTA